MQRTTGALLGALTAMVVTISAALLVIGVRDLGLLPFTHIIIFTLSGLLCVGLTTAVGAMMGDRFASRSKHNEGAENVEADVIDAILVPDGPPPSRWITVGACTAKWGWILGLFGILLCALSGVSVWNSVEDVGSVTTVPLIVAIFVVSIGGLCTIFGLITMVSRFTPQLLFHFTASGLVNAVFLLALFACGILIVGHQAARDRQKQLASRSRSTPQRRARPIERVLQQPRLRPAPEQRPASPPPKPLTLQEAVAANRVEDVQPFLDKGANINEIYRDGQTLLIRAATRGNYAVAKLLLENGADVNGNPEKKLIPLSLAIREGHPEIAALILKYNPNVNAEDMHGYTPIHHAANLGFEDVVRELLVRNADVQVVSRIKGTALQMAARRGDVAITRLLLENGADPNIGDGRPATPLHHAVCNDHTEVAKLMIEHGARVNVRSRQRPSPLHEAVARNNVELVKFLLEHGADPDYGNERETLLAAATRRKQTDIARMLADHEARRAQEEADRLAAQPMVKPTEAELQQMLFAKCERTYGSGGKDQFLHAAAKTGDADMVKALLDAGADATYGSSLKDSLLTAAIRSKSTPVVDALLEAGTEIEPGHSLNVATYLGATAIVRSLLRHGADINAESKFGQRPLLEAIDKHETQVAKFLLANDADVNVSTSRVASPLSYAIQKGYIDLARLLLEHNPDVRKPDRKGAQPLHFAARFQDIDLVQTLLDRDADIHAKDEQNKTPLCWAIHAPKEMTELVQLLLDHGADPSVTYIRGPIYGDTSALHLAVLQRHHDTIRLLLSAGADVNTGNKYGITPLHSAVRRSDASVVRTLIECGADPSIKTKLEGQTALDMAEEYHKDKSLFEKKEDE